MLKWIKESNRWKHMLLAIPFGVVFTILCVLGLAIGMEFKDCHHSGNNANIPIYKWDWEAWDWLDLAATMIGGAIGQAIQVLIIVIFI